MISKKIVTAFCGFGALSLGDMSQWTELKFSKISANKVTYAKDYLQVEVDNSASPLIFKFSQVQEVREIKVNLEFTGAMKTEKDKIWSETFEEDSLFRIGLVAEGSKKLSAMSALFAPDWVKKMFSLAPPGVGLDKIYFYNVTRFKELVGQKRIHPASEYMSEENVIYKLPEQNEITFSKKFTPPIKSVGAWLSIDGDDSKSKFKVRIKSIEIL